MGAFEREVAAIEFQNEQKRIGKGQCWSCGKRRRDPAVKAGLICRECHQKELQRRRWVLLSLEKDAQAQPVWHALRGRKTDWAAYGPVVR